MSARRWRDLLPVGMLLLLAVLIILPVNPAVSPVPNRDSGVFLYIGRVILEGGLPYRDAWDHKPPAIFLINALGLALSGSSWWGVWLIELLSLLVVTLLAYALLRAGLGETSAIFGTTVFLLLFILFWIREGGNFPEEYSLAAQFLALWLIYRSEKEGRYGWRGVLIGACAAFAFLLKQNLAGIWLAWLIYLIAARGRAGDWRRLADTLGAATIGFGGVALLTTGWLAVGGALKDFWEAAFVYNWVYSRAGLADRVAALGHGLLQLALSGVLAVAAISWAAGALTLARRKTAALGLDPGGLALLWLAVLGVPLELGLAALSGRQYFHYYLAWLPVLTLLAGFFPRLWGQVTRKPATDRRGLWLVLVILTIVPGFLLARRWGESLQPSERENALLSYIQQNSAAGDTVLLWGAEAAYNFAAGRRAPGRFVYQYPLLMEGFATPGLRDEFVHVLHEQPPALIVDAQPLNPHWPPLTADLRRYGLGGLADLLAARYQAETIPDQPMLTAYRLYRADRQTP